MCDSRELVSRLMGRAVFEDLLIRLPDAFYSLPLEAKDWVWDELLGAVNQGIEDPKALAVIAEKLIQGELVDTAGLLSSGAPSLAGVGQACSVEDEYTKEFSEKLLKEHGDEPVFEMGL
jgi:hypothetical protein